MWYIGNQIYEGSKKRRNTSRKGIRSSLPLQNVTYLSRTRQTIFSGQRSEQVLQPAVMSPNQPAPSVFEQPAPSTSKGMGILPKECQETADLLLFFDNLFDSVNGSYENTKKRAGKPLLGPVTPNSTHKKVWAESKKIISSMKFCSNDKVGVVPTITNWLQTIENIEYLVNVLAKKYN